MAESGGRKLASRGTHWVEIRQARQAARARRWARRAMTRAPMAAALRSRSSAARSSLPSCKGRAAPFRL